MKAIKAILVMLSIAVTAAFLHAKESLSIVPVAVALSFYLLATAIHLLIHEMGHFVGGKISGYRLLYLQIGPMYILADENRKLALSWKKGLSGQCAMVPKDTQSSAFRAYNLGGIYANVLLAALSVALLLCDSLYISLFAVEFICTGLHKGLLNAIPHKTNAVPNDGYVVKLLKKDRAIQKDYLCYLKLYGALFWNQPVSLQDYQYERDISPDADEMIYYNEIQDILKEMKSTPQPI